MKICLQINLSLRKGNRKKENIEKYMRFPFWLKSDVIVTIGILYVKIE